MQIKSMTKPEGEWLEYAKAYKRGQLKTDPFVFAKAGAQAAGMVMADLDDSTESRRKRFDRVCSEVRSVINEIERKLHRPADAEWLRGYLCSHTHDFQGGRRHFYNDAISTLHENPDFLADLGRFEYNAGRLLLATEIFEKLFPMHDKLSAQPLQAYRWLAKVYRHTRNFKRETSVLEQLRQIALESADASSGGSTQYQAEDIQISRRYVIEHYGQSLISAGRYDDALNFIRKWIQAKEANLVKLGCQGTLALLSLSREEEASKWAEDWTIQLDNLAPLTTYFTHSKRPFSAMKMKEKALAILSEKEASDSYGMMIYSDNDSFFENCSGAVMKLYKEAQSCFNNGFYQEGVEAAYQFAEGHFATGEAPTLMANCMAYINEFLPVIPRTKKLEALFAEARDRFDSTASVVSQYGRFLLLSGKPEEALEQFKIANGIGASKAPLFPVLMGKAYADLGEEGKAKHHFETPIKKCTGADLVLAYLYAVEWASLSGRHFDVLRWYSSFMRDFLQAKVFPDGDLGGFNCPRNQHVQKILRLSGQAAFALKDYAKAVECFDNLLANHGGLLSFVSRDAESHFSYRYFGEATLLLALACCLKGDVLQAKQLCSQASQVDPDNPLLPAIKALNMAADGKVPEAVTYVLSATLEEWLFSLVGGFILEKAETSGGVADLATLRSRVGVIRGDVPTHAELLGRFESQSLKLAEAEENAKSLQQTFNSFKQAMQSFVENVPLPDEILAVRTKAIEEGEDIEDFVDKCVKHLVKQYKKEKSDKSRYKESIPEGAWQRLDSKIQERIVAADRYVAAILDNVYDFGPAFLALSSALEILLKERLVNPLTAEIRKNFAAPDQELKADLKSGSLGTIPYLLAYRGYTSQRYQAFLNQWISRSFPNNARYMLDVLPGQVSTIAALRNSWAHGGDGVRFERYQEMEKLLFDRNDGVFMRIANT